MIRKGVGQPLPDLYSTYNSKSIGKWVHWSGFGLCSRIGSNMGSNIGSNIGSNVGSNIVPYIVPNMDFFWFFLYFHWWERFRNGSVDVLLRFWERFRNRSVDVLLRFWPNPQGPKQEAEGPQQQNETKAVSSEPTSVCKGLWWLHLLIEHCSTRATEPEGKGEAWCGVRKD